MKEKKIDVKEIDLNDILPNRFQPRIKFNENLILELSESIKEHGVIQPIIVRPIDDKFEIVAGERRFKASVLAGLSNIPSIVLSLEDKDSIEYALLENVQREDLSAIEEAITYKKILDMGYITQVQLAQKIGKSQSAIANKLRLLKLCDEVQEALMERKISERHARSLLNIESSSKQRELLYKIIKEKMTVRQLDKELIRIKEEEKNHSTLDKASEKIVEEEKLDDASSDIMSIENEILNDNKGNTNDELINKEEHNTIDNKSDKLKEEVNIAQNSEKIVEEEKLDDASSDIMSVEDETLDDNKQIINDELVNEEEEKDNMYNNESNTDTVQTGGRFFNKNIINKEEINNRVESKQSETPAVFDFSSGKVVSANSNNTSNNIFTGSMEDLLAPKSSVNSFENNTDSNQDKIFLSESNKSNNIFNVENTNNNTNNSSVSFNSIDTTENSNPSIFGDLMRKEELSANSNNSVDKNSLDKYLDPTYVDGVKKEDNSSTQIDNPIFSMFKNNDLQNDTINRSVETNNISEEKNDGNVIKISENFETDMKKPDLLAPMGNNFSNNISSIQRESNQSETSALKSNIFPVEETQEENFDLTRDNTINEKEIVDDSKILVPSESNDDMNNQPIFVNSSFNKEELSAPTTPIITNIDMSNLLSKPIAEKELVEPPQKEDVVPTIPESSNIPTTNNNFMTSEDIQPIIITDYNKQYDPILPVSNTVATPTIDFKHILNLIRNLNDEIEGYGYKIETEEIDLEDKYQVIFNIEKQ